MPFSPSKFDSLLETVAQEIIARFPPVVANDPERTVSQERIKEIVDETFGVALQSEREHQIGFLRRIQLKSALRLELREIGYDEKFADFAVERFMAQLTPGPR
jgi:hypothetical protein